MIARAKNAVDDAGAPTIAPPPTTPHELHAYGLLTPAGTARYLGNERHSVHRLIADGALPTTTVLGSTRIEPLVAWAARQGATRETLHAVAAALRAGQSVDAVIALVQASPPAPRTKRGRKKKQPAPPAQGET